jgi:hypothetical protein
MGILIAFGNGFHRNAIAADLGGQRGQILRGGNHIYFAGGMALAHWL